MPGFRLAAVVAIQIDLSICLRLAAAASVIAGAPLGAAAATVLVFASVRLPLSESRPNTSIASFLL